MKSTTGCLREVNVVLPSVKSSTSFLGKVDFERSILKSPTSLREVDFELTTDKSPHNVYL